MTFFGSEIGSGFEELSNTPHQEFSGVPSGSTVHLGILTKPTKLMKTEKGK